MKYLVAIFGMIALTWSSQARAQSVYAWTDPAAWAPNPVPGAGSIATVNRHVVLTGNADVGTVKIVAGGLLEFAPSASAFLKVHFDPQIAGSGLMVVDDGTLRLR